MILRKIGLGLAIILSGVCFSACSMLSGDVKRDLNEMPLNQGPTTGGRWSERGILDQEEASSRAPRMFDGRRPSSGQLAAGASEGHEAYSQYMARERARGRMSEDELENLGYQNTPNLPPGSAAKAFKNGFRASRADFQDDSVNEASLWGSDGQTNYYFSKNKTRSVGDIVSITAEQELVRDVGTEISRTLSGDEREVELEAAQERINTSQASSSSGSAASPARSPANAAKPGEEKPAAREATPADIDVTQSMGFKAGDSVMAEIVERYPNGNCKVRGTKRIPYRGSFRFVTLTGIVRNSDISDEDVVSSGKLYEYRLESMR